MALTEKIRVLFEVDDKGSFGKLKRDINEAEGATGKAKAGAKGLGDMLRNNTAAAASAAGAALVAFGLQSVKAFQDTALEAGRTSEALGINVEDASRLKEVAGDLGIDMGTLQGAMQRFNKEVGAGKVDLKQFGTDLVYAKDGSIDAYESFINAATAIGAIEDPTKRAQAAQATFGRSYGEIAELMEMDAGELRTALAGVSDAKVIDEEELDKARRFRDAMDNLGDVVEDLKLAVGEMIVENADMIEDFTTGLTQVANYADELFRAYRAVTLLSRPTDAWREAVGLVTEEVDLAGMSLQDLNKFLDDNKFKTEDAEKITRKWKEANPELAGALDASAEAIIRVDRSAEDFTDEAKRAKKATDDLKGAYRELKGELSDEEAWLNVESAIDDYKLKIGEAGASNRDKRLAMIELKTSLLEYLEELKGVPAERQTEILALIDQGKFDEAERALGYLSRQRSVAISPTTGGQLPTVPRFDSGGVMPGPKGQHNLALVAGGETILPTHKPGVSVPGASHVVNIYMPPGSVPRDVENASRRYLRRQGPV